MQEKSIEKRLVKAVKEQGGLCPKLISPGMDGMPDRIILLPGGRLGFIEVKAPGERPRPIQEKRIQGLRNLGFRVFVVDSPEKIGGILDEIHTP